MNRFWDRALCPVLDAVAPRLVVEVGVAQGALTRKLLDWAATRRVMIHAIDPEPQLDVRAWRRRHRGTLVFHKARSLNVLGRLTGVDAALIDGDHNWYTVINELRLLERAASKASLPPPLIALHDVDWPYGRRDMYYKPESIPARHRHRYERRGIVPAQQELSEGGLNDGYNNATCEHTSRNGVRTAVEDFLAGSRSVWTFSHVPGLHGLGILAPADRLEGNPALVSVLRSLRSARFLRQWCDEVELARIETEIEVARRGRALDQLRADLGNS